MAAAKFENFLVINPENTGRWESRHMTYKGHEALVEGEESSDEGRGDEECEEKTWYRG